MYPHKLSRSLSARGRAEVNWCSQPARIAAWQPTWKKRGEGMHHLCIEVEDIDAALAHLKALDGCLINTEPEVLPGRKMAFIHPKAANGVLIELYQLTE